LNTGRVVDDCDLRLAFEIETGLLPQNEPDIFERWMRRVAEMSFEKIFGNIDDRAIEEIAKSGYKAKAILAYRDLHGCSIRQAKDYVDCLR